MSAKTLASIFAIGDDIVYSESDMAKKNTILLQTGDATVDQTNTTGGSTSEYWSHVGFASKPSPVSGSGKNADAAQSIGINCSDGNIIFATRDTRYQDIYANLKPGETAIYGTGADGGAQGRILIKQDGSINLFTTKGNSKGASAMGIFVSPSGSITAATPSGNALMMDDSGCKLFNSSDCINITGSGIKLVSGASISISAPAITLGGATALPVAIGPNTVAAISALQTQITALQSEVAGLVPLLTVAITACIPGGLAAGPAFGSGAAPLVAAGLAAVVGGAVAVSTASAIIPAMCVSAQ